MDELAKTLGRVFGEDRVAIVDEKGVETMATKKERIKQVELETRIVILERDLEAIRHAIMTVPEAQEAYMQYMESYNAG